MFARLPSLISKLIPHSVAHRWNLYKVVSAITALALVFSLLPLARDLQSEAAPPSGVQTADIIVDDSGDGAAVPSNCEIEDGLGGVEADGGCRLRDAIDLADDANTIGANRILFDTAITDIVLDISQGSLLIDDAQALTIRGNTISNHPYPIIDGSALVATDESACTTTGDGMQAPILRSISDLVEVDNLSFINAVGNAIEVIDATKNSIVNNWIGTSDRITDPMSGSGGIEGNGLHGICVNAVSENVTETEITGNIIVANGNDGIRLEGSYGNGSRFVVEGTFVINNLIGSLTGEDTNNSDFSFWPGNRLSGITAKMADFSVIQRNIITNNGWRDFDGSEIPTSDGITLLEANDNLISENYLGTTQDFKSIESNFPWTGPLNGLDSTNLLDIASNHPGDITDYASASNACDGVAMRFYDHVKLVSEGGGEFFCPDPDFALAAKPTNNLDNFFFDASDIGPSVDNFLWTNDIGYNLRNGIWIQSLACVPSQHIDEIIVNAPNVILDGSGALHYAQSAQNSFLQNSIFRNDGSNTNGSDPVTGSGTYGIGIDLEDYATAGIVGDFELNSYWAKNFSNLMVNPCDNVTPAIQPLQPVTDEVDFNITENDEFTEFYPIVDGDDGIDPDAGANRLTNFPIIDELASISSAITGTAAEGTVVELFQVICTTGTTDDVVPTLPTPKQAIRDNCDEDFWHSGDFTNDNGPATDVDDHDKGHGQGFRFLGNAFVPFDGADGDEEGTWTISPADFADGSFHDVDLFVGGLVTATATAVNGQKLCWDDGTASACDPTVEPAALDVSAQRAGSTGSGGVWAPNDLINYCSDEPPPLPLPVANYIPDPSGHDCIGSTSEFSPNALIVPSGPTYSLVKNISTPIFPDTVVASGETVEYTIVLTNNGSVEIAVADDALSDTLPSSVTATACTWTKEAGSLPLAGNCNVTSTPLAGVNFGTLEPGAKLIITITTEVDTNLNPNECFFFNEVIVTGSPPISTDSEVAVESGSTGADHVTETLTVDPCDGQTGTGTLLEKQISVNGGAFANADTPVTAVTGDRSDTADFLIHFSNNTGTELSSVFLRDDFPFGNLFGGITTVDCWLSASATDSVNDPGDPDISACTWVASDSMFDADDSTPLVIDPFTVPDGQTLHIRINGLLISPTYPVGGAATCNTAEYHTDEPVNLNTFVQSDDACFRVFDPGMQINKSLSVNGSGESSVDSPGPGPGVPGGGSVSYFIDVLNSSPSTLNNVRPFDIFPGSGLDATGWTCNFEISASALTDHSGAYAGVCAVDPGTGEIDGGFFPSPLNLASGEAVHIRLTGKTIPVNATGTFCNFVRVLADQVEAQTDSACMNVTQEPTPGLQVYKSVTVNGSPETSVDVPGPGPDVPAGGAVTYFIDVANNSATNLTDIHLTDTFPAGLNVPPAWLCEYGFASDGLTTHNPLTYTFGDCTVDASGVINGGLPPPGLLTLIPGQVLHIRLSAKNIPLSASGVLCNRIDVTAEQSSLVGTDSACVNVTTTPGGQVDFEKEATNDSGDAVEPDVFELGDTVKYRVTVRNTSGTPALGLTLKDPIPEEEEDLRNVVATSGAVNPIELSSDRLQVDKMDVAANSSVTVDYDVSILDDNDFPLDNYDLDPDADHEDEDFYPVDVEDDDIGTNSDNDDPEDALDAPDGHYVSLGEDGEITVRTSDEDDEQGKLIVDGNGDDFCVVEVDPSVDTDGTTEEYEVEVSQTSDNSDFESVGSSTDNSDCFDIEDADMTWARFVRITETSSSVKGSAPGSDIDAVCLLNLGGFVTNTATLSDVNGTVIGTRSDTVLVDFTDAFDDPLSESDCQPSKETRTPSPTPTPLPPPPQPPVTYYPPIQLPRTGAETQGLPLLATGILGMIGWVMKRRGK